MLCILALGASCGSDSNGRSGAPDGGTVDGSVAEGGGGAGGSGAEAGIGLGGAPLDGSIADASVDATTDADADGRPPDAGDAGAGDASAGLDSGASTGEFRACGAFGVADVRALAYLPDGSGVAAALGGSVAKILAPSDGREVRSFIGHTGAVNAVAVTADGTTLVTASDDATVKVWRISDGALVATLSGNQSQLLSVALSPDGTRIAAGAANGDVLLFNRSSQALVATAAAHTDDVRGVGFAAGGARIFTASLDGSIRIWSAADLSPIGPATSGGPQMRALAVSPDGAHVAVGDAQGNIHFWRASDGSSEGTSSPNPLYGARSLAYAPDGSRVYAVMGNTNVYSFPVNGSTPALLSSPIGSDATLAVSPDGESLFFATSWALWLTDQNGQMRREPVQEGPFARGVAFWPDGSRLLIGGSFGIVVRSLPGGDVVAAPDWGQFAENYNGVDVSPDGNRFATADEAGSLRLWSASTWTSTVELTTATIRGERVAFSPDGLFLAVTGSAGLAHIYRVSTGEFVTSLGYSDYIHSVAFSPEGSFVAVGTESRNLGIVRTSDWSDVRRITDVHSPTVNDLAFSPDGQMLASTGDQRVTLWEVNGDPARRDVLDQDGYYGTTVAISPDGALLVAGGYDGQLRMWSMPTLLPVTGLPAHGTDIVFARFSPDGRRLAVAHGDGTVWLWCR